MKVYGEVIFDILYLLIAIVVGICILIKSKNKLGKMMGIATLVLGCGDAFHLVPRTLDYFIYLCIIYLLITINIKEKNI